MADGKPGRAPCGHKGEHVIGTYVRCTEGCENLGKMPDPLAEVFAEEEKTDEIDFHLLSLDACPACGSYDVEDFATPIGDKHCNKCGHCFMADP